MSAFLTIPDISKPPTSLPSDYAIRYEFTLDHWQQHAVAAIHNGHNVLVTAKTGSGKTLVGEYQIAHSLSKGKRVFYTTPIKSLSNQKYNDLKHLFPAATVGIMTGDIKSNPEADIVVMTTEILRNLLFKQSTPTASIGIAGQISLVNVDAVIFDEVHYVNDPDRGHVWEETLIMLPAEIQLILLSATIDSAAAFAGWLGDIKRRPITLLQTTHRIVPLIHGIFDASVRGELPLRALKDGDEAPYKNAVYANWIKERLSAAKSADKWADRVAAAKATGDSLAGSPDKVKLVSFTHTLNECVSELQTRTLLPALFFVMSRKECERYAAQISGSLISSSDTASIKHIMSFHLHRYDETLRHLPQYHQLTALLERGIAFHHSGVLPLLKEMIELLFSKGLVKILFCTETFAVGLNMPARTVVFLDMKKPCGDGFRPFRADEYIQMAGRAGRRGKDTRGIVLYLPARQPVSADELRLVFCGGLKPLESRLQFHYDFILKAIYNTQFRSSASGAPPLWETLMNSSFWNAQRQQMADDVAKSLTKCEVDRTAIKLTDEQRRELDYRNKLQYDMKTLTNAGRRTAAQELEKWTSRHMGPVWRTASDDYIKYKQLDDECLKLRAAYDSLRSTDHSARILPILHALQEWGVLETADPPTLSPFGIMATEVNEVNPLMLAKIYASKRLHDFSAEHIVTILAALIVDREAIDNTVHPYELHARIPNDMKAALVDMDTYGQFGAHTDSKFGVESPDDYWSLATYWVEITYDWVIEHTSAAELTKTYEIYEGNLIKGLHKLSAIVNEWISIATYVADVDMLHKMQHIPEIILRDIVVPESLYLKL
jgi:superfamily II RNA helicase